MKVLYIYIYITFYIIKGISPSASLITDLKAIAGDNNSFFQVSSLDDLYPKFNDILQKIAVCPVIKLEAMTVGKLFFLLIT